MNNNVGTWKGKVTFLFLLFFLFSFGLAQFFVFEDKVVCPKNNENEFYLFITYFISCIASSTSSIHVYASLVWVIKDLMGHSWHVVLHHTLRERNVYADFLAKHGASQEDAFVVIDHPLEGMSFLF